MRYITPVMKKYLYIAVLCFFGEYTFCYTATTLMANTTVLSI